MIDYAEWAGFFSYKPTKVLEWILNSPCKITCLFCISAHDYVYTNSGAKLAGDLVSGDRLYGQNEVTKNELAEDDLYRITFSSGIKIECNGKHPLYWRRWKHTVNGEGFHSVESLYKKKGYRNSCGYAYFEKSDGKGEKLYSPKLLGYLCSDGYFTNKNQSIKFTNNNETFLSEVEKLAQRDFDIKGKWYRKNNGYDLLLTKKLGELNKLKSYMRSLGTTLDSFGKIQCGDRESLKDFVAGYFNGDGYLLLRKRKKGWSALPSVEVGFCIGRSYNRAIEFQYILWKLGISSWVVGEYMGKSLNKFYRVKVNAKDAKLILPILDDIKYPEKFELARKSISGNRYKNVKYQEWVAIRSIEKIGRGKIAILTTQTGEFLSYCGMRNHNSGNQFGKGECAIMDMILSILGWHPNPRKNILPTDNIRTIRFASQTLPGEKEEDEVRNTQYPVLKRRLPPILIEKDITARKPVVTIKTPTGRNVNIEFVSFSQEVQAGAGVQRKRIWMDEESSKDFYEEQIPRLLAADGDILFTFTPVPGSIGWEFDELYERAKYIYRTENVRNRIKERTGEMLPELEMTGSKDDICVIMAATDDNPIYEDIARERTEKTGVPTTAKQYIDEMFSMYDDEDVVDARRYGLFRQLSGKIHKSFSPMIHVIQQEVYLPEGIPNDWKHFRGIDYHTSNPWACIWLSVSPQDEIFVWCDYSASPQKMITYDIAKNIAERSGDYKYLLDLIDPLANTKQVNTNFTTIEDLNRYFSTFRKDGLGLGAHWMSWDTKGGRGREEFTKRLLNSIRVGKPFNNKVIVGDGNLARTQLLPTIWISNNCKHLIESMKNWRREEWGSRDMLSRNDPKETEQKKWSHFPITVESMLKSPIISNARWGTLDREPVQPKRYLTGRG